MRLVFACGLAMMLLSEEGAAQPADGVTNVFITLIENKNLSDIKGNPSAPYINDTLLPMSSYAEQYYNPPGIHPSLPNYLWLEAGDNFGIFNASGLVYSR